MRLPPPLDPHHALFLDLDGTLLEIASQPELVTVPEGLSDLLRSLAERHGGALAIVSGRRIAELDRLLRPWRGPVAGIHGAERRDSDGRLITSGDTQADEDAAAALDRLRPALRGLTERMPGVLFEDKGRTLAIHYRAAPEKAAEIRSAIDQGIDQGLREHG